MSGGNDLEFDFQQDTQFFAFHFNLLSLGKNLFTGMNLLEARDEQKNIIRKIFRIFGEQGNTTSFCHLQGILIQEIAAFLPSGISLREPEQNHYENVLDYIRKKADATTTIGNLADLTGMSEDCFSRNFSKNFGVTAKQYLNNELVLKAEKHLKHSGLKIREIAFHLGFHDEYYFSRFFKKETGLSPKEYRNTLLPKEV